MSLEACLRHLAIWEWTWTRSATSRRSAHQHHAFPTTLPTPKTPNHEHSDPSLLHGNTPSPPAATTSPPEDALLTPAFVQATLEALNANFLPALGKARLDIVREEVLEGLRRRKLVGRAVLEVWEAAAAVWVGVLVGWKSRVGQSEGGGH